MRITKVILSAVAVMGCFLSLTNNIAMAANVETTARAMDFIQPLPTVPQQLAAGETTTIDYKLISGWTVDNIVSNYEDEQGDIVNLHTCSNLPERTSCVFSLKITPKKKGSLPLQLRLSGNDQTVFLNEPRTSIINVISVKITKDPKSNIVATGGSTFFIVDAIGSPTPLKYQWKLDGEYIQGATSKSYVIKNAAKYDAGKYTVVVSANDGSGSVTSKEAILQVGDGPVINTQPESKIVATSTLTTFSVAATGLGELKYQWLKDGEAISGATGKDYTISKTTQADAGEYQVKVIDGTQIPITSDAAILQVGDGPVIGTQPKSKIVVTDDPVTFSVAATGLGELKYQWLKDRAEISGAIIENYTISETTKDDSGEYQVKVTDGTHITKTSDTAVLQVGDAPTITTHPQSQKMCIGGDVKFSVVAVGAETLRYQWYKNGALIDDATDSKYLISHVGLEDAASYSVEVSNDFGKVVSNEATLTVGNDPIITSISPSHGKLSGGDTITVNGDNFTDSDTVDFLKVGKCKDVQFISSNTLTCVAPSTSQAGVVDVQVTDSKSGKSYTKEEAYIYVTSPIITNVTPNQGHVDGGIRDIRITGSGFSHMTDVTFAGESVKEFATIKSDTEITLNQFPLPPYTSGPMDVDIAVASYEQTSIPASFSYYRINITPRYGYGRVDQIPVEINISPSEGKAIFSKDVVVTFGTQAAADILVSNDGKTITCKSPSSGITGNVTVTVANPNSDSSNATFRYLSYPIPRINNLSSNFSLSNGGKSIRIFGENLASTKAVWFDEEKTCDDLKIISDNEIECVTPNLAAARCIEDTYDSFVSIESKDDIMPAEYTDFTYGGIKLGLYMKCIDFNIGVIPEGPINIIFNGKDVTEECIHIGDTSSGEYLCNKQCFIEGDKEIIVKNKLGDSATQCIPYCCKP